MSTHTVTLSKETTIPIKPAEVLTASEFDLESASVNLAMETAGVSIKGTSRAVTLYPVGSEKKSATYLTAEAAVHANLVIMAKEAIDSGNV